MSFEVQLMTQLLQEPLVDLMNVSQTLLCACVLSASYIQSVLHHALDHVLSLELSR